jgi:hypothetical protein
MGETVAGDCTAGVDPFATAATDRSWVIKLAVPNREYTAAMPSIPVDPPDARGRMSDRPSISRSWL